VRNARQAQKPNSYPVNIKNYVLLLLLNVVVLSVFTGCKRAEVETRPNIILISLDTVRSDHVSCYGYPRPTTPTLDRLAQKGALFKKTVSRSPWTLPAHMSIMTGLPPSMHQVEERMQALPLGIITLAQVLKNNEYNTGGFAASHLLDKSYGFSRGFDQYVVMHQEQGALITESALKWLSTIDVKKDHFFLFLHYFDPHWPYNPPKEFGEIFGVKPEDNKYGDWQYLKQFSYQENPMPPEIRNNIVALYDADIRYTDHQVNVIVDFLETNQLMNNTIVIICSDHGEEFKEHGSFGHGHSFHAEVINVPLIMYYPPKIKPRTVVSQPVVTSDVPRTVLKLANIPSPKQFHIDSEELSKYFKQGNRRFYKPRTIIMETTERGPKRFAALKDNFKYIQSYVYNAYRYFEADNKSWYYKPEQLFDGSLDAAEIRNLLLEEGKHLSALKTLNSELANYIKSQSQSLQLSFIPSPHDDDDYEGVITLFHELQDEPAVMNLMASDIISPIEKAKQIKFQINVKNQPKKIFLSLSPNEEIIGLVIHRNGNLYFEQTLKLPKPGTEIPLKKNYLSDGGCLLQGTLYYLKKDKATASLSQKQIERLKALGYL